MYDIIGDVHGQAYMLKRLLKKRGYREKNGFWKHERRKAVFVGDFINRGPSIRETVLLIKKMVEGESAYAILGNHELNALIYELRDKAGKYIGKRLPGYRLTLEKSLKDFHNHQEEWREVMKWMRTLPLYLDFGEIRIVHACWKDENIRLLEEQLPGRNKSGRIKKKVLTSIARNNSALGKSIWETVKGVDFQLPHDLLVFDSRGKSHRSFRMKWWQNPMGKTFKEISFESRFQLPDYTIPHEILPSVTPYPEHAPILFFGHYCLNGRPHILSNNICCVDSCISRTGKLLAYGWDGETEVLPENLVSVSKK